MQLALIVPGPIEQLTGGYLFARHIVEELRRSGDAVDVIELPGNFPNADAIARAAATAALAALPDGATAVIDGLALAGFANCLAREAPRLRLLGFIHHPLAEETGLTEDEAARFRALEQRLLPCFRGILCPSRATADALLCYGVDAARIAISPPGTAKPLQPHRRSGAEGPLKLLSVATITPRKGHRLLIEALASLRDAPWQLDIVGSEERDPACAAHLRAAIAAHDLAARIHLHGEKPQGELAPFYARADLFVLPSFHEGYGMAFAEALAQGLPIVATNCSAIPDTVPADAGVLVPPGDTAALAQALQRIMVDRALLAALAAGAARACAALRDWPEAAAHWREAVLRFLS